MRNHDDALGWVDAGTTLLLEHVAALGTDEYDCATLLPGWNRKHLIAHLAGNADALGNLAHWAATGEPTPMYRSSEQRDTDIAAGALLESGLLQSRLIVSAGELSGALESLTPAQWTNSVVTAQGRTVPATEIPWLRAREVCVHAVDLATGATFTDLPEPFLDALVTDIVTKRGLDRPPVGPLPEVAAYLAGRPHSLTDVPDLGPWL